MILWYNVINVFYCIRSNLSTEQFNLTRMKWKFSCDFSLTVSIRQHWTFWLKKVMNWYLQVLIYWTDDNFSPVHLPQSVTYDWFLSSVTGSGWKENEIWILNYQVYSPPSLRDISLVTMIMFWCKKLPNIIDMFDRSYRSGGDKT